MNKIKIYDHIPITIDNKSIYIQYSDAQLTDPDGTSYKGVYATVRATHAARRTGNHGLYLPAKMMAGAASMTAPYEKPIGVHHEEKKDPIGRIKLAKYVRTPLDSAMVRQLGDFYKLEDSVEDFDKYLDIISRLSKTGLLDNKDFPGLGYILATGLISDPDAAQKVRDGRYQTVSITANTNRAVYNSCLQDWAGEKGRCEHDPGELIDGQQMFLIAGDLEYEGYDWVNCPADELASLVSIQESDNTTYNPVNCITNSYNNLCRTTPIVVTDSIIQSDDFNKIIEENQNMPKKETEGTNETTSTLIAIDTVLDKLFTAEDSKVELTKEEVITVYDEMSNFLEDDEKISADKWASLPSSSFCGPFLVLDSAHVIAAQKLVNSYKGTGSKDLYLALIDRKGKAMGCEKVEDTVVPPVEDKSLFDTVFEVADETTKSFAATLFSDEKIVENIETEKIQKVFLKLEKTLVDRKVKLDLYSATIERLNDELTVANEKLTDSNATLGILRSELKLAYSECQDSNENTLDTLANLRSLMIDTLDLYSHLTDNKDVDRDVLAQLSIEGLTDQLLKTKDAFDLNAMVNKIHDGTVPIEDSTKIQDSTADSDHTDHEHDAPPVTTVTFNSADQRVMDRAKELYDQKGLAKTRNYLQGLRVRGIIKDDQRFLSQLPTEVVENTDND